MLFPELLGAFRLLLVVLNPTTWIDVDRCFCCTFGKLVNKKKAALRELRRVCFLPSGFRPDIRAKWAYLWSTPVLVTSAAIAESLKLAIGYVATCPQKTMAKQAGKASWTAGISS